MAPRDSLFVSVPPSLCSLFDGAGCDRGTAFNIFFETWRTIPRIPLLSSPLNTLVPRNSAHFLRSIPTRLSLSSLYIPSLYIFFPLSRVDRVVPVSVFQTILGSLLLHLGSKARHVSYIFSIQLNLGQCSFSIFLYYYIQLSKTIILDKFV